MNRANGKHSNCALFIKTAWGSTCTAPSVCLASFFLSFFGIVKQGFTVLLHMEHNMKHTVLSYETELMLQQHKYVTCVNCTNTYLSTVDSQHDSCLFVVDYELFYSVLLWKATSVNYHKCIKASSPTRKYWAVLHSVSLDLTGLSKMCLRVSLEIVKGVTDFQNQ